MNPPNSVVEGRYVVVGIVSDQPPTVVRAAADFARRFDAELVCATFDSARFTVTVRGDGTVATLPFVNGSVAAQLAHRQHRPVVVIPTAATSAE